MDYSSRDVRVGATMRSVFIAVLVAGYAWVSRQPAASLTITFLIAAGLQLVVIALRRFVPPDRLPQAIYIFEIIVDGLSVLLFSLGVFGGILKPAADV
jgi:hypothetical protein